MITSFRELNLSKFREIQQIVKDGGDWQDINLRIVSVLSGKSFEELCNMPIREVSELVEIARFLDDPIPEERVPDKFKIESLVLVPSFDVQKFTTAQYVDFQQLMKAPDDNQVEILSCLLIPKGKKYNVGYDLDEVKRAIAEHISVSISTSLFSFFLARLQRSTIATLRSSEEMVRGLQPQTEEEKKKKIQAEREIAQALHLLGSGDGLPA